MLIQKVLERRLKMENLAQNKQIKDKIALASRKAIVALHRVIFEEEGDRGNRKRLREFGGFDFADESDEYRTKLEYATRLTTGDLTSICNILGLDYVGTKEQLLVRIIQDLINLNSLNQLNSLKRRGG